MQKRILLTGALIVALTILPGCPGGALAGLWLVTLSNANTTFGLEMNANGTASPFGAPSSLGGEFKWELDGTEFFLYQTGSTYRKVYAGRVSNNASISGAWVQWEGQSTGESGLWSATKQ
jgi:hypothetical protein